MRKRRIGKRKASIEHVTALVNLTFLVNFSEDKVREALMDATQSERRHAQVLRAKARYRQRNRELLALKERQRRERIKNAK